MKYFLVGMPLCGKSSLAKIIGKEILKSIKPDQMIIKLVQDELINILGSENNSRLL